MRHALLAALAALLCILPGAPAAAGVTAEEARIAAHVDAHTAEALALLLKLVDVNSGTMNHAGVREVGRLLRKELDDTGFATRWIDLPGELNRAGHLFAERKGKRGKRLLLIGHLDTVFEKESPFQTHARIGDRIHGPGIGVMKGGDVVLLYALKTLQSLDLLKDATITVALTGDEQSPGHPIPVSRRDLVEAARRSDVALEFEAGLREYGRDTVTIARRSSSRWTLRVTGQTGHSSQVFTEKRGSGAAFEVARILSEFHEKLRGEPTLTFSVGLVLAGTEVEHDAARSRGTAFGKANVVPRSAVATGNIRTLTDAELERTRAKMREIVAKSLPGTSAEIEFVDRFPSWPPTEGNRRLLGLLNDVNRDLGLAEQTAIDPLWRGAGDIAFVSFLDGLAGLGPTAYGAHTPEESIDPASLPVAIKRAALLIYRLTR